MVRRDANRIARRHGQAYVEYLIVTAVVVAALTVGVPGPRDPSVVGHLVNAIKRTYSGYSYGISLAELPDNNEADRGDTPPAAGP